MDYGTQTLWPVQNNLTCSQRIRGEAGFDYGRHSATTLRRGPPFSVASTFATYLFKYRLIMTLPTNDSVPLPGAVPRISPHRPGDDAFFGEHDPVAMTVGKVVARGVAELFCCPPFTR